MSQLGQSEAFAGSIKKDWDVDTRSFNKMVPLGSKLRREGVRMLTEREEINVPNGDKMHNPGL